MQSPKPRCHDETSCMEAVKQVALALNEILQKEPLIMKRQVKTGRDAGSRVEGIIDLDHLPTPKIVMINCSFDSVRVCILSLSHTHTHMYIHIHNHKHMHVCACVRVCVYVRV